MTVAKLFITIMTVSAAHAACFGAVSTVERVTSPLTVAQGDDLHISAADDAIAQGASVDMSGDDCRLFFDNIRPGDVIERYSGSVTVRGEKLEPDINARIRVFLHGTEILPHSAAFTPLEARSLSGKSERYAQGRFYTNSPSADVPEASPLALDDDIHSISLARGYMATLATNPDGTGYSRCFIAENENLNIDALPRELDGKVSFVRVLPWKQVSKKGWVGGNSKTNPPEGYFEEQADALLTTWAYNWGTSADYGRSPEAKGTLWRNQEFVAEKWGAGGDSDWRRISADYDLTHLLSYNEPDHGEQSNVTVERAIEEWPRHLATGLRLGSPATTDFAWLYRFMDECRSRNYRVDFVAIHAYWGGRGSSVQVSGVRDWYKKLKEVHDRTGCPLWITEWNNGANWTHETWPSDKAAQQEKQRRFMEEVLEMMDTCSFIERYSVYNWVEEKRSMFWGNLNLTPAGKVYRDFKAAPAFSRQTEVIPGWNVSSAATASIGYKGGASFELTWTDDNLEQVDGYTVERSVAAGAWTAVADCPAGTASYTLETDRTPGADIACRVVSVVDGRDVARSNQASYANMPAAEATPLVGRAVTGKGMTHYLYPLRTVTDPVLVTGVQTWRMKSPMTVMARLIDSDVCAFGPESWMYNATDAFVSRDTLPYMVFPAPGTYDCGGLRATAGKIDGVTAVQSHVAFGRPFDAVPVVLATVSVADVNCPCTAQISGVTAEGFDVRLMYERTAAPDAAATVDFVALSTGTGSIGSRELVVGRTAPSAIGTSSSAATPIGYGRDLGETALFCAPQTGAADVAGTLRATHMSGSSAAVFMSAEASAGAAVPVSESIGWCAVGGSQAGLGLPESITSVLVYDSAARCLHRTDGAHLPTVTVYDTAGAERLRASDTPALSTCSLPAGMYIASATGCGSAIRFVID